MTEDVSAFASAAQVNLIKLAVGIESPAHLARVQARRLAAAEGGGRLFHVTRNTPRRVAELLNGGSIYWVIKGRIRVRQRLLGIETENDREGRRRCRLVLDPRLVAVAAWSCRAFQGWRYLAPEGTPPDAEAADSELPDALADELRELGLL
ncbi:MAG: DUF1489 domain-containing protein [Rhodospirillales bacterium]|nr:MAG: DUF1489 domain-containing protein [Rhodospirillales bacterium]